MIKKKDKSDWKTYKAIIINSEDVLLLRNHVTKATTCRVLEWNARSPRTKKLINIIPIIKFIIKTRWNLNSFWRVTILNNDQMIRFKIWPPHFQEIKVPYSWNHNVKFIFQWWWRCSHSCNKGRENCLWKWWMRNFERKRVYLWRKKRARIVVLHVKVPKISALVWG